MAIRTRWRIPPENSCGYCPYRRSASGMPASVMSATARRRISALPFTPLLIKASAICAPTFIEGLRLDIGSCGTRPTRLPRMVRMAASDAVASSSPARLMDPWVIRPFPGSSRRMAPMVVDFPEPDWPTMATRSPSFRSKLTSWSTAVVPKVTSRFLTVRMLLASCCIALRSSGIGGGLEHAGCGIADHGGESAQRPVARAGNNMSAAFQV